MRLQRGSDGVSFLRGKLIFGRYKLAIQYMKLTKRQRQIQSSFVTEKDLLSNGFVKSGRGINVWKIGSEHYYMKSDGDKQAFCLHYSRPKIITKHLRNNFHGFSYVEPGFFTMWYRGNMYYSRAPFFSSKCTYKKDLQRCIKEMGKAIYKNEHKKSYLRNQAGVELEIIRRES
jgi:hypothetical protein